MELLGSLATPKTPRTPLTAKALNSVAAASDILSIEIPKTTKKERKAAKKAAKAMDRDKVVTSADIKLVAEILHPNGEKAEELEGAEMEELEEDLDIKANLKFNNSTCNSKSVRHDYIAKDREQKEVEKAEVERVLLALDVNPKAIGKEGELVTELSQAIKNDLVHHQDELKIVARNKAGFWRWANKRNYRDLVENGKDWDAKHEREPGQNQLQVPQPEQEERRESDVTDATDATINTVDTEAEDEAAASRSDSVVDSLTDSAGTALTIPSKKASSRKASIVGGSASTPPSTPSTKNSSAKKAPTLTLEVAESKKRDAVQDDDGWTTVGKKVLKPPVGTLTFSANGGLHHLEQKPKSNFWALSKLE